MRRKTNESMQYCIRGLIFEINTLLNVDELNIKTWRHIAEIIDLDLNEQTYQRLNRVNTEEGMKILCDYSANEIAEEQRHRLVQYKKDTYWEYLKQISPKDVGWEIPILLERLRKSGFMTAVYSWNDTSKLVFRQSGLGPSFDAAVLGKGFADTPNETLLKAAESLQLFPEECVYVSDREDYLSQAMNTNIKTCFLSERKHSDVFADYYVRSLDEIAIVRQTQKKAKQR